jgi:hypothetical protein
LVAAACPASRTRSLCSNRSPASRKSLVRGLFAILSASYRLGATGRDLLVLTRAQVSAGGNDDAIATIRQALADAGCLVSGGPGCWPCWRCSSGPASEATSGCPTWSGSRSPVTTCLWRRPRRRPARPRPLPRLARPGQPRPACAVADSSKLIRPPPRRCRVLPGARSGSGTACGSGGPGRRAGRTRAGRRGQGRPERGRQPLRRPAGPVDIRRAEARLRSRASGAACAAGTGRAWSPAGRHSRRPRSRSPP